MINEIIRLCSAQLGGRENISFLHRQSSSENKRIHTSLALLCLQQHWEKKWILVALWWPVLGKGKETNSDVEFVFPMLLQQSRAEQHSTGQSRGKNHSVLCSKTSSFPLCSRAEAQCCVAAVPAANGATYYINFGIKIIHGRIIPRIWFFHTINLSYGGMDWSTIKPLICVLTSRNIEKEM